MEVAKKSFNYTLENALDLETELTAKLYLLQINMETNSQNSEIETQFNQLLNQYGRNNSTVGIQVIYAEFLAFNKNETSKAISTLKEVLKLPLTNFKTVM